MKLITSLIILTSNDPDLSKQMREAVAFIKTQPKIPGGHLCKETISAILKMSKNQRKRNKKFG